MVMMAAIESLIGGKRIRSSKGLRRAITKVETKF